MNVDSDHLRKIRENQPKVTEEEAYAQMKEHLKESEYIDRLFSYGKSSNQFSQDIHITVPMQFYIPVMPTSD